MNKIRCIVTTLLIPLLSAGSYLSAASQHDSGDMECTDSNSALNSMTSCNLASGPTLTHTYSGRIQITMPLPDCHGAYVEIFGSTNLLSGEWTVVESWIPTYHAAELFWEDAVRTNLNSFFYMILDATLDFDGDGFSDAREHYISLTDPETFDDTDEDHDGLHDFWEIKLFGDIRAQNGYDDSDGDGLPNNRELVWLEANRILMQSDPTLFDTDGEGLDDHTELLMQTDPLSADSDSDGFDDAFEVLGSPPTDPNNPDITAPILALAGG